MAERIGLIGYGAMGSRMAARLLAAGHFVVVYDIQPAALDAARAAGAAPARSPGDVAAAASTLITMLPDAPDVEQAVLGEGSIAAAAGPGSLLIEMSSSYPPVTRRLHQQLAGRGVDMIDAPVSGGTAGAEAGTLTVMVGGDPVLLERARPILAVLGSNIVHVGPIGSGHTIKALNNLLSAITLAATSEAMTLAVRSGITAEQAVEVFSTSSGRSWSSEYKFPKFILPGTFNAGFTLGLLKKDVDTAVRLGREADHPMLLGALMREVMGLAVGKLGPRVDHTELARLYEEWSGVEVRGTEK